MNKKLEKLKKYRAEVRKYEDTIRYYKLLYAADGEIDELEQERLNRLNNNLQKITCSIEKHITKLSPKQKEKNRQSRTQESLTDKVSSTDDFIHSSLIYKHIIQEGESLYGIAKKYKVTIEKLMEWNNLKTPSMSQNGYFPDDKIIISDNYPKNNLSYTWDDGASGDKVNLDQENKKDDYIKLAQVAKEVIEKKIKDTKSNVHYLSGTIKIIGGVAVVFAGGASIILSGGLGTPAILGAAGMILGPTQAGLGVAEVVTTLKGELDAADELMKTGTALGAIGRGIDKTLGTEDEPYSLNRIGKIASMLISFGVKPTIWGGSIIGTYLSLENYIENSILIDFLKDPSLIKDSAIRNKVLDELISLKKNFPEFSTEVEKLKYEILTKYKEK